MDIHDLICLALQIIGACAGIYGSYATGSRLQEDRRKGFLAYILSNAVLIVNFWMTPTWPLLAMQLVFLYTSIRGMWNNSDRRAADAGQPQR